MSEERQLLAVLRLVRSTMSKSRSSWDSTRIDYDFVRSETAELDARRQFFRRLTTCIVCRIWSNLVQWMPHVKHS